MGDKLREALEFYADERNYHMTRASASEPFTSAIERDGGARASAAIDTPAAASGDEARPTTSDADESRTSACATGGEDEGCKWYTGDGESFVVLPRDEVRRRRIEAAQRLATPSRPAPATGDVERARDKVARAAVDYVAAAGAQDRTATGIALGEAVLQMLAAERARDDEGGVVVGERLDSTAPAPNDPVREALDALASKWATGSSNDLSDDTYQRAFNAARYRCAQELRAALSAPSPSPAAPERGGKPVACHRPGHRPPAGFNAVVEIVSTSDLEADDVIFAEGGWKCVIDDGMNDSTQVMAAEIIDDAAGQNLADTTYGEWFARVVALVPRESPSKEPA